MENIQMAMNFVSPGDYMVSHDLKDVYFSVPLFDHIKYVDQSALDKDLMILKKALGNKIPLDERMDWELPYIIERYKRSNVDIFSPVLNLD